MNNINSMGELEKVAFLPLLAMGARYVGTKALGMFGRKAATNAVETGVKKGLGSKVMSGVNTAGNMAMVGSMIPHGAKAPGMAPNGRPFNPGHVNLN